MKTALVLLAVAVVILVLGVFAGKILKWCGSNVPRPGEENRTGVPGEDETKNLR